MSQWLNRYENHPIHKQIAALDRLMGISEEFIKGSKRAIPLRVSRD